MKSINIILLLLILSSCNKTHHNCNDVGELNTPLRVISLGSSDWEFNTVMVIDDKNKLYTLKGACFQSLQVGDTIQ
jgi:hypothetical protein